MAQPPPGGGGHSYSSLRERLDEMGYFQGFLPECLPLVEALFNDLLTTTHNLKVHKDKLTLLASSKDSFVDQEKSSVSESKEEIDCSSVQSPPNLMEYEKREEDLQRQIKDLEALNSHALQIVSSLQEESLEKSKKISKLEASQKARISEKNLISNQPKMEITSYIKPNKSLQNQGRTSSSSQSGKNRVQLPKEGTLDIIKMFENKNKMLNDLISAAQEENRSLRAQLMEARESLKKAASKTSLAMEPNPKSSSYISKILKDNAALKERIKSLEEGGAPSKVPFSRSTCHRLHSHHDELNKENHGRTGKNRVHKHMEDQHLHIHELEDQLRSSHEEIRDLKLRISHLQSSKKSFKDKIEMLQAQQKVLVNSKDASKMKELVSFMEKQRNIYRNNVHELLDQLGPDYTNIGGTEASKKKVLIEEVPLREGCAECRRRNKSSAGTSIEDVTLNEYKESIAALKREKIDLISRFEEQQNEIREKESVIQSTKSKMEEWRARAVSVNSEGLEQKEYEYLTRELKSSRDKIQEIMRELKTKEQHMKDLSEEKDEILRLLDDKTLVLEKLKEEKVQMINDLNQLDSDKAATDSRVASVMSQMNAIQLEMKTHQREKDEFRGRYEREKTVGIQLRRENNELKMELEEAIREKEESQTREMDIKSHTQKYINEVKRIEELLLICERERSELLEQYKHLSSDVSSAEVHNRKLESKVSSLELTLKEKEIELHAAETRIQNLEKDLAEMSLSNENFRLQLASFTVRADLAESELKEARNQQSWINNDLSSVHELAVTLNSQKVELINKISEQESEIHVMTQEIERLKAELTFLRKEHLDEKMKSKALQSKLSVHNPPASNKSSSLSSSSSSSA